MLHFVPDKPKSASSFGGEKAIRALGPKTMSPQEKALYSKGQVYNTVSGASALAKGTGVELR